MNEFIELVKVYSALKKYEPADITLIPEEYRNRYPSIDAMYNTRKNEIQLSPYVNENNIDDILAHEGVHETFEQAKQDELANTYRYHTKDANPKDFRARAKYGEERYHQLASEGRLPLEEVVATGMQEAPDETGYTRRVSTPDDRKKYHKWLSGSKRSPASPKGIEREHITEFPDEPAAEFVARTGEGQYKNINSGYVDTQGEFVGPFEVNNKSMNKAWEEFKKYDVRVMPEGIKNRAGNPLKGAYDTKDDSVYLGPVKNEEEALDALLHEGQHSTQYTNVENEEDHEKMMNNIREFNSKSREETYGKGLPVTEFDALMAQKFPERSDRVWEMNREQKKKFNDSIMTRGYDSFGRPDKKNQQ